MFHKGAISVWKGEYYISGSACLLSFNFTGLLVSLGRIGLQEIEQELLFCSNHNQLCLCTCVHNLFMHGIFKFTDAI